jgi:glutaredoxin
MIVALYQNWGKIEHAFAKRDRAVASVSDVTLYATSWCGYCRKTRQFLADKGIAYTEYDIEQSAEGRRQYDELGGRGVPVLVVNGTVIHGYGPEKILAALK